MEHGRRGEGPRGGGIPAGVPKWGWGTDGCLQWEKARKHRPGVLYLHSEPRTTESRGRGTEMGDRLPNLLYSVRKWPRNIDTEGHISRFLSAAHRVEGLPFFLAVLSNPSASHRVSKVGYRPEVSNSAKSQSFCMIQGAGSTVMTFMNRMGSVW